jgi:hypothetical protein
MPAHLSCSNSGGPTEDSHPELARLRTQHSERWFHTRCERPTFPWPRAFSTDRFNLWDHRRGVVNVLARPDEGVEAGEELMDDGLGDLPYTVGSRTMRTPSKVAELAPRLVRAWHDVTLYTMPKCTGGRSGRANMAKPPQPAGTPRAPNIANLIGEGMVVALIGSCHGRVADESFHSRTGKPRRRDKGSGAGAMWRTAFMSRPLRASSPSNVTRYR